MAKYRFTRLAHNLILAVAMAAAWVPVALAESSGKELRMAAKHGELSTIKRLLEEGAYINDSGKKGRTPLHVAAKNNQLEVVRFLIEAGADVNSRANNGATPLISAAYRGYTPVVQALLAAGANKDMKSDAGNTAMDLASKREYYEVVDVLKLDRRIPGGVHVTLHIAGGQAAVEEFQRVATAALASRGWKLLNNRPTRIEAETGKRGRLYRVALELVDNLITINFIPFYASAKQNYLVNLQTDINSMLGGK